MRTLLRALPRCAFILAGWITIPSAKAADWNRETVVKFSTAVELPDAVLQPGTYVFKLADNDVNRSIVQVFTEDRRGLVDTIQTIPAYRLHPTPQTVITFEERGAGMPEAVHTWFYPDSTSGVEFQYPGR